MAELDTVFFEDFVVSEWVNERIGARQDLSTLRDDLSRTASSINSELVASINRDYQSFVSLSTQLESFEHSIRDLKPPLQLVRDRLHDAVKEVDQRIDKLQEALSRRDVAHESKQLLQDFVRYDELLQRIERFVTPLASSAGGRASRDSDDVTAADEEAVHTNPNTNDDDNDDDDAASADTDFEGEAVEGGDSHTDLSALSLIDLDDETRCAQLYRSSTWFAQLAALQSAHCASTSASSTAVLPFYRVNESRVTAVRKGFAAKLTSALGRLLQPPQLPAAAAAATPSSSSESGAGAGAGAGAGSSETPQITINSGALEQCLRAFDAFGTPNAAEQTIKAHVFVPFYRDTFTEGRADSGLRGSYRGLRQLFDDTISFLRTPLPYALLQAAATVPGVDVVGNSMWEPLVEALSTQLPRLFSLSAVADTFHSNYLAFSSLFSSLRTFLASIDPALESRLTSHPCTARIRDKWARTLPVYYGVRFQELSKPVKDAVAAPEVGLLEPPSPLAHVGSPTRNAARLAPTAAVWSALVASFSPDTVFLPALTPSFTTLAVQALGCYRAWITNSVAPQPSRVAIQLAAAHDCSLLSHSVETVFVPRALDAADGLDEASQEALSTVLTAAGHGVGSAASGLVDSVAATVSSSCSAVFSAVQNLSRQYNMTNKPMPTKASAYVKRSIEPLRKLLSSDGNTLQQVVDGGRVAFVGAVLAPVVVAYEKAVEELLEAVAGLAKNIGWLRTANKGGADGAGTAGGAGGAGGADGATGSGAGGAATDQDKINAQVRLDVTAFLEAARSVGMGDEEREEGGVLSPLLRFLKL